MPRVSLDSARITCSEDSREVVETELKRLRAEKQHLSNKRFKIFAESYFKRVRKTKGNEFNLIAHGGRRRGSESEPSSSEDGEDAGAVDLPVRTPLQEAVGTRAADLIAMLVQIHTMAAWFGVVASCLTNC